jgi:hypothetical protein
MHNANVQQTGFYLIALENKTTARNLTLCYVIQYVFLINLVVQGPSPELQQLFVNIVRNLWILDRTSHCPLNKKYYARWNHIK